MATDYVNRMYWPKPSDATAPELRTTYGRTIALSAKLGAADRRNPPDYAGRHQAFIQMCQRQKALENQEKRRSYSRGYQAPASTHSPVSRNGPFKSGRGLLPNVTTVPLDLAIYNAPNNDPFVPDNSYKQYVMRQQGNGGKENEYARSAPEDYTGMLPVHRLYRSTGAYGYDDPVKASQHIHTYRPDLQDLSEYKVRQGRNGGAWRHVKEVMQGKGERIVFIDGQISVDELMRVRTKLRTGRGQTAPETWRPSRQDLTRYFQTEDLKTTEGVNFQVMR